MNNVIIQKQKINFWPKQLFFSIKNAKQRKQVEIQNISCHPIKLKFKKPQTKYYQIIHQDIKQQNYIISPGLSKKIEIQFKKKQNFSECNSSTDSTRLNKNISLIANSLQKYYDSFKIVLEDKKYQILLKAQNSSPIILYDNIIDLGFVDMNKVIKVSRKIINPSSQYYKIRLFKQTWQNIHIIPQQLNLKANSQQMIQFSFTPMNIGAYHHKILVQANQKLLQPIQIIYSTYDYSYFISDKNGNKITETDFGLMYYGEKKNHIFYAVNNTPNTVQMKAKIRMGFKSNPLQSTFQSPQQFGQQCCSTFVQIFPKNIKIGAFSKQKFTLTTFGKINEIHEIKVSKYSKTLQNLAINNKNNKKINQMNEKYKIQDDQYHQTFYAEFVILSKNQLKNKNDQINNKKQTIEKRKKSPNNNQQILRTNINNIVLTQLKGIFTLPKIKITPCQFDFGKINLNKTSSRKFIIKNISSNLSSKISFNKIIGVEVFPKQTIIKPTQSKQFQIYVSPVNLGIIDNLLKVKIQDNFIVQCQLKYQVKDDKLLLKVKSTSKFASKSTYFNQTGTSFYMNLSNKNDKDDKIDFHSTLSQLQKTSHNQFYRTMTHSASSHFKIRRNNSSQSKHQFKSKQKDIKSLLNKTDGMKCQIEKQKQTFEGPKINSEALQNSPSNRGQKKKKSFDYLQQQQRQIQYRSANQIIKQNKIALPCTRQNLFVTKKIDKYQPYTHQQNNRKLLKSTGSKQFFSNIIRRQPRHRRQAQQINMQLSGQTLKFIKINTKVINFNKMFVGSRMTKQFIIQNDSEYSIQIRLKHPQNESHSQRIQNQMLNGTDYQQQIISPHSAGTFKICLWAKQCGKFQKPITYIINRIHEFQFLVQAQIELAQLNINKNVLKMVYLDDISQMFLKDSFTLKNQGNAATQFNISQTNNLFLFQPSKGIVQPGNQIDVCVTYKNPQQTIINAGQSPSYQAKQSILRVSSTMNNNFLDQRISIDIKNGINMSLKVTFSPTISQPKCAVKQNKLNFGVTIVSKSKNKSFLLKNLSRTMTLFEIDNNECSQFLYFDIIKGKLPPQSSKQITVTYKSSVIKSIQSSFKINVRGGLTIIVPVSAESVAPNIRLGQQSYNFGDICCGSAMVKPVNVINDSQTTVQLLLDLLDKRNHGTQYLYVSFIKQQNYNLNLQDTLSSGDKSIFKLRQTNNNIYIIPPINQSHIKSTLLQQTIDNACLQPEIHKLKVSPKSVYTFYLVFKPKLPGFYSFQLPLYLQNFIKNDALNHVITCFATQPKFIIQPSIIKFKKKIICEKQNTTSSVQFLTLKNPGDKQLKWKIQLKFNGLNIGSFRSNQGGSFQSLTTIGQVSSQNIQQCKKNTINPDKFCFQIQTLKGVIKPGSTQCINITFNPFEAGYYNYKLPLMIYNQQKKTYQQQAQLRLQGQGQYPSLFFDRKQLIMPVVPIGIQSVAMFKIINQGYQSISLKHKIQILDLQGNPISQGPNLYQSSNQNISTYNSNIPDIKVNYPQGIKMSLNKRQLYIIVQFTSKKTISFTCKLQIYDNTKDSRIYSLPVSGTVDNSILTLFPYLSNKQNRYKFIPIVNNQSNLQTKQSKQQNYIVNIQSTDVRNAVDKVHNQYEKMSQNQFIIDVQIIRRWMNNFLKDQKVAKFPQDIISYPQNLLRILFKMTQKKQFQLLLQFILSTNNFDTNSLGYHNLMNINNQNNISQQKKQQQNNTTQLNKSSLNNTILNVPQFFASKLQFYEYLIKLLKSMGCLLNHIRPYFLLDKKQFYNLIQKDLNWKNMSEYYHKIYNHVHTQTWIILFYQIVNCFWYNTSKLKASLNQSQKASHLNSYTVSNVYSTNEMTILKWIRNIYDKYAQFQDTLYKFLSYNDDFKDCIGPIYAIYHHLINPNKKKKALQGLSKKPNTGNQITSNIKILYSLIQKIGFNPLIYEQEYQNIRQKEIFLFLYQLYQILPQQLPKTQPIQFNCLLGEKCSKFIQIKNPSNKVVHYWVRLQGSRDFSHEQKDCIRVQPKSIYKFKVNLDSRVSSQQHAYITFLNKLQSDANNTSVPGSTLVFQLKSKIIGRKSIKKLQPINCSLYQTSSLKINIDNPFEDYQYANFQIFIFQQSSEQADTNKNKLFPLRKLKNQQQNSLNQQSLIQNNNFTNQKNQQLALDENNQDGLGNNNNKNSNNMSFNNNKKKDDQAKQITMMNFFLDSQSIKIKRNSSSSIQLVFNPIIYTKMKCYIIFYDPIAGEFQYQITGICQMPKILQQIRYPTMIYTGNKQFIQINIPAYNNFMIKANIIMEQKLFAKIGKSKIVKKPETQFQKYKIQINMDPKILQYVTFPHQHIIKNIKKQMSAADLINKFKFQCNFLVVIKDLALDFLLVSQDKKDVRRIKLHINLANRPILSQIVMRTTARMPIIQPIPIQNTSQKDWRIKITLSEQQQYQSQINGYLSLKMGQKLLTKDFILKKQGLNQSSALTMKQIDQSGNSFNNQNISVVFYASWTCKLQGKLSINNMTTNQQLIYVIKAISEQPVSEGHLYYKVKTCSQQIKKLNISNPYPQNINYKVQTDLQQLKLPDYVFIDSHGTKTINLTLQNITAQQVIGYLKFIDQNGRFFWYTVTLQFYNQDKNQKVYFFDCQIGQQAQQILQIHNPTDQKIKYYVNYPQKCFVKGQTQFQIQPYKKYNLNLFYIPTSIIDKRSQIKIKNKNGAIGYKIWVKSKQSIKKKVLNLTTQIGKAKYFYFKVSNPSKNPIKINCQLSNKKFFTAIYNQLIPPHCMQHEVKVEFLPLIQGKFSSVLKITGDEFELQFFDLQGISQEPHSIQKIEMKSNVSSGSLQVIKFRNPNLKQMKQKVQIYIQDKQFQHNCFKIIKQQNQEKSKKWIAHVVDLLGIPIQFFPLEKGFFQAMLYIKCSHYQWKYLLQGTILFKPNDPVQQKIQGQCKKQTMKVIKMQIPKYIKQMKNFNVSMFDHAKLQHQNHKLSEKFKAWTNIKILSPAQNQKCTIQEQNQITLYLKITASQPVQQVFNLVISSSKNSDLRLIYRIKVSIKPCKPQQTITLDIESLKRYKFELNLDDLMIGSNKKTDVKYCQLLKNQFVEVNLIINDDQIKTNNVLTFKNLSSKILSNKQMPRNIAQVIFSPTNLTFSTKMKNTYSQILMIYTQKSFWSYQLLFRMSNQSTQYKKMQK